MSVVVMITIRSTVQNTLSLHLAFKTYLNKLFILILIIDSKIDPFQFSV